MPITASVVGLSVCAFGLLLQVIGLSIPYWLSGDVPNQPQSYWNSGLWDFCGFINNADGCVAPETMNPYPEGRRVMAAVRAMELLGVFTCTAALTFAVIKTFNIKILLVRDGTLAKLSGAGSIVAGVFMLIGVIVFAAKKNTLMMEEIKANFHASFGLCTLGGVLSIISGIIFLLNRDGATYIDS